MLKARPNRLRATLQLGQGYRVPSRHLTSWTVALSSRAMMYSSPSSKTYGKKEKTPASITPLSQQKTYRCSSTLRRCLSTQLPDLSGRCGLMCSCIWRDVRGQSTLNQGLFCYTERWQRQWVFPLHIMPRQKSIRMLEIRARRIIVATFSLNLTTQIAPLPFLKSTSPFAP